MECKEGEKGDKGDPGESINRNIVECKVPRKAALTFGGVSINRNIVECKALRILLGISLSVVLIETSWNVKEETYYCDCDGKGY